MNDAFVKGFLNTVSLPTDSFAGMFVRRKGPAESCDEEKVVRTSCRACIANCGVLATVKNGRVVKLEGNPEQKMSQGRLCAKGLSGIQALYNPNRLKYPLLRVGKRGENKWRRISWDEALDIIADKIMQVEKDYGIESVMCSTGGGGNPQFSSIARFCNLLGTPNWFEPGCAQCYLPRHVAYFAMYGGTDPSIADSNGEEIYFPDDTPMKCLCLWGTDPSYSCPGQGGGAIAELRARGLKTVVIDPRMTPDAAKATVWLPIRPGTDAALMLCWIRYILEHKLYNEEFVMKWTNLPYLVNTDTGDCWRSAVSNTPGGTDTYMVWDGNTASPKPLEYPWDDALAPALDAECVVDGVTYKTGYRLLWERCREFTLEKAAEICWLQKDKIEEAILTFCNNTPGGLCIGVATDQNPNSVQCAMGAAVIDLLLGNVEQPGSLLQRFGAKKHVLFPGFPIPFADQYLPYEQLVKRLGGNEYKGLHIWHAAHAPTCLEAIKTGKPYPIKVWLDRSGNKLAVMPNGKEWIEALDNIDLIVHMYMYPTSFSAYADILLPTVEWLETNYPVNVCNTLVCRQAVTRLYEGRDEGMIWAAITKRLAEKGNERCAKAFDPEYIMPPYCDTEEELLNYELRPVNMTWEEFKKAGIVEFMPFEDWKHYYVYKDIDPRSGKERGFSTRSRKCEIYAESLLTLGRTGLPYSGKALPAASKEYDPLPYYLEPSESPMRDDEISREYPLVMTNGRLPMFHHGTLRNVPWMRELYPQPEVWINPVEAEKYGVADGDWVWVESQRGKIRAKANVTTGIGEGVVYMERYWNPENLNSPTHGWQEMNVNVLSKSAPPYNDIVGTYTLRGYLVRVSKAEGPPEGVWTKPEDFKAWLPEYPDDEGGVRS